MLYHRIFYAIFSWKKWIRGPIQKAVNIVPIPTKEVTSGKVPPLIRNSTIPKAMQTVSVAILTY